MAHTSSKAVGKTLLTHHSLHSQAATTLFERYWENRSKKLRHVLSGIILFGTPHTTKPHQEGWIVLSFLLRTYFQLTGQTLKQAELEGGTVAQLSEKFEELVDSIPLISVYESKPTRTSIGLFGSKKRLVSHLDRSLSEFGIEYSSLISWWASI
jgi:hypothetical protein